MNPYPGHPDNADAHHAERIAQQDALGEHMERRREQLREDALDVLAYAGADLFARDWARDGAAWEILVEMMDKPDDWHRLLRAGMTSPETFRRELRRLAERYAEEYVTDERLIKIIDEERKQEEEQ